MKRTALIAVVMVLALSMAISGTIAYLTDTDSDVNVMTLGNVNIEQLENGKAENGFENGQPLYPAYYEDAWESTPVKNGAIQKEVNVKNIGSSEAYVRTLIAFEAGELSKAAFDKYIHTAWETQPTWIDGKITVKGVNYFVAYVDYDVVAAGAETADSLQKIVMDKTATNEIVAEFGDTYEVLVLTQAIQTNNFDNKATAWTQGFGEMTDVNVADWFGGVAYNTVYEVSNAEELKDALDEMKDQPYAVIKLTDNVTWKTGAEIGSTPIVPADSAVKNLVINGQGAYTLTATGAGVGSLRAANGGTIAFKDITIDDESVSYAEDAWEYTYLEFAGNLTFDHVTFKSGVQFQTEGEEALLNATFTNCAFESNEDSVYAAWISDGTAAFKNCSFNGTRGIKVHEEYGSEVASVTVDNCIFVLSKKPGMAIGTLNADTTVSITNSAFDTQAGDQNLFIYETDTNVNNFKFSESGNTLAVTVKNADELAIAVKAGAKIIKLAAGEYDVYGCGGKNLTISGSKDAVIKLYNDGEDGCDYAFGGNGTGVGQYTFNGITIDTTSNTGNYKGFAYMGATFNDCNFVGAYSLNNANDFVFNNCTFDFKNGYLWTWGANSATFNGCTFKGNSKCILAHGYASTVINIKDCIFAATEEGYTGAGDNTAAVEIDPAGTNTYTINFTGNNTKTASYNGWTRVKDGSTGHTITGLD